MTAPPSDSAITAERLAKELRDFAAIHDGTVNGSPVTAVGLRLAADMITALDSANALHAYAKTDWDAIFAMMKEHGWYASSADDIDLAGDVREHIRAVAQEASISDAKVTHYKAALRASEAKAAALAEALRVPEVWSSEEARGMVEAFDKGRARHGLTETLFAVAAWLLRHRAALAAQASAKGPPFDNEQDANEATDPDFANTGGRSYR